MVELKGSKRVKCLRTPIEKWGGLGFPLHLCDLPQNHTGKHRCRCLYEWSDSMKYFYWARAGEKRNDGGAIIVASSVSDAETLYRNHCGSYPFDIEFLGGCGIEDFPEFTKCVKCD